jgi:heme exporter protein D
MPDKMYFDSFAALLAMDGHGVYVWITYLLAVLVLSGLFIQPLLRRRELLKSLADQSRRQSANTSSVVESN